MLEHMGADDHVEFPVRQLVQIRRLQVELHEAVHQREIARVVVVAVPVHARVTAPGIPVLGEGRRLVPAAHVQQVERTRAQAPERRQPRRN
jgi:hypothetical protein